MPCAIAFQRRPGQMRRRHPAVDPGDQPARFLPPVRRAQARQRGNEDHARRVRDGGRELLDVRGLLDQAEPVAQPLDDGSGDERAPFQRIRNLAADLPGDGPQQAVLRSDLGRSGVHQEERAGPVRALGLALFEACLSDQRALLISRDTSDGDTVG